MSGMRPRVAARIGLVLLLASTAHAAGDFAAQVNLDPLRTLVVQQEMTLKTLDTFARQTLTTITGRAKLDGQDPLYTVLDIVFRPEQYVDRPLIRVRNIPLRMRIANLAKDQPAERERIEKTGMVSLSFHIAKVDPMLTQLQAQDARLNPAIQETFWSASALATLCDPRRFDLALAPPGTTRGTDWKTPRQLLGNSPKWTKFIADQGNRPQAPVGGYDGKSELLTRVIDAYIDLGRAWRASDAATVNRQTTLLAESLPAVNPQAYPSAAKRSVEVWYNRLQKFTIPGFAFYFIAFACFLMSARAQVRTPRRWGLFFMALAVLVHTAGIAIRWWIAPVGRIPIMNQFESVMASAWFGAVIGLILELCKPRGIFGAAASFVGWLSLIALWATPIVTGIQIGAEIGQVAGILLDYWLYIHVNLVIASYALIGMSFLLGMWWLVQYARGGSAAAAVGDADGLDSPRTFPGSLDLCNMVVLQLAFWVLGAGIICGAVWADHSWGRPWGWDPKETFALVTWIVYLIVVHVRLVASRKALWTASLSVVAFFVMLFNWIGVNFFLVGLHSYA
jgi:cytochrome c-type biogenesis protein CcsB